LLEILDFYERPTAMTSGGAHAARFDDLPRDVAALTRVVHGLLLHEHWAPRYGVALSHAQRSGSQIRPVERMLDRLLARDPRPLGVARRLEERLVGVCRHFTVLLVAMLRARGVAARARCGFGGYFTPGRFEDHWVCECWSGTERRWILVDAQIDELQRGALAPDFDVLDVPRDRFLVAGEAWARCRRGDADPSAFGIFEMRGLWFVAGNLLRDLAALNHMEMLPWDVWGAMAGPDAPIAEDRLELFDRLAALTREPDPNWMELRALYERDERLRVPSTVFNAVRNRPEAI
jgi:hypothetical protein